MIAREGWSLILLGMLLTVVCIWVATRWDSWPTFSLSLVLAILTVYTAFFFRDPERSVAAEPNVLVAPADGRIVAMKTLESHAFIGCEAVQISIFLSIFDVHINRVPTTGTVDYVKYKPGKFMAAFKDKASEENERTEIGMTTGSGQKLIIRQIAGLIARRVVYRLRASDNVTAGDRFGMIRFGSRVDLLVPADSRLLVKEGDRVFGGESIVGYLSGRPVEAPQLEPVKGDNAQL